MVAKNTFLVHTMVMSQFESAELLENLAEILIAHLEGAPEGREASYIGAQLACLLLTAAQGAIGAGIGQARFLVLCQNAYGRALGIEREMARLDKEIGSSGTGDKN